jgi:phosphatidylserine/phosphatidylglycerophosphate/cardiolipin synthase-like enzyme
MHHKFVIIDGETVETGSPNWTRTASRHNRENMLIITKEKKICESYEECFEKLIKECEKHETTKNPKKTCSFSLREELIKAIEKTTDDISLLKELIFMVGKYLEINTPSEEEVEAFHSLLEKSKIIIDG